MGVGKLHRLALQWGNDGATAATEADSAGLKPTDEGSQEWEDLLSSPENLQFFGQLLAASEKRVMGVEPTTASLEGRFSYGQMF